jgi:outer membrane protein OmpA-like peptidoglycan-associated protein
LILARQISILAFTLFLLVATPAIAQDIEIPSNPYKLKRLARYAFENGNYHAAIRFYEAMEKNGPSTASNHYFLGECHLALREHASASEHYKAAYKKDLDAFPDAQLKYAKMLKMTGRYSEAATEFSDIQKNRASSQSIKASAKKEMLDCEFALESRKDSLKIRVMRKDDPVNAAGADFAPIVYNDNDLIISSISDLDDSSALAKLYLLKADPSGSYKRLEFAEGPFHDGKSNTANGNFSPDRDKFYFTRCNEIGGQKYQCVIYVSEKRGKKWSEPRKLGKQINQDYHTSTHPFATRIKKDEILFFVSDRPGGSGGKDIWFSVIKNGKEYSDARNLGTKINSPGDEVTPFYDEKNATLYFSSDGMKNMGGFDIYSSRGTPSKWSTPENTGYPINSSADDIYFIPQQDRRNGYIVSNRSCGKQPSTCCDHIYSFSSDLPAHTPVTSVGAPAAATENDMARKDTVRTNFSEAKSIQKNTAYILHNVYFEFDDADLTAEATAELDRLVDVINESDAPQIEISAHTDNRGTEEYNNRLSQMRAEIVMNYLIKKGIDKKRIMAKGYGESQPIAPNSNPDGTDNPEGRLKNRRIEFKINN